MLTERDLEDEIYSCLVGKPNVEKVIRLAACYTVRDHLFGGKREITSASYSYAPDNEKRTEPEVINIDGVSEFLKTIKGKDTKKVLIVISDLMETMRTYYPKQYESTLAKLQNL